MSRCFCAAWSGPPIFCIHKPLPRLNDSGSKPPNRPHVSIMNERSFRFLQPLRDLLHATSLDERRCILCHIPFSPLNRGNCQPMPTTSSVCRSPLPFLPGPAPSTQGRLLPLVRRTPALLRLRARPVRDMPKDAAAVGAFPLLRGIQRRAENASPAR